MTREELDLRDRIACIMLPRLVPDAYKKTPLDEPMLAAGIATLAYVWADIMLRARMERL